MKFIVASDKIDHMKFFAELLRSWGYGDIQTVDDGFKALWLAKTYNPDVVLTGASLPGLANLELIGILKELDRDCFVAAILDEGNIPQAVRAAKLGADEVLAHPLSDARTNELRQALLRLESNRAKKPAGSLTPPPSNLPFRKLRILVVDDEPGMCSSLSVLFSSWSFDVQTAGDAMEAGKRVVSFLPDVVVTDVVMPEISGLELLRLLKRDHPECFVLMMSAQGNVKMALEAINYGADDFFTKPITDLTKLRSILELYEFRVKARPHHTCFISYSSKDVDFARRLYADLQNKHVRCWFAPEDLKVGDRFRQRIHDAVRANEKLILILSKHSIRSKWVEEEVEAAADKESKINRPVLYPVSLDQAFLRTRQAWAASLRRTRHVGDFRGWQDSKSYIEALNRLMTALDSAVGVSKARAVPQGT